MTLMRSRLPVTILMLLIAALLIAACGNDKNDKSRATTPAAGVTKTDPDVVAAVPAAIKSRGTLVVAADASYPPNEFIDDDGRTVVGMDADLAEALAGVMGLKSTVKNETFDAIIPGLAAKKYDLGMSSFTDSKVREKVVDFVTYFTSGTSFYTKAQGGAQVSGLDDICGLEVAVEKGTTQADDATAQSKKCASGKKATVSVYRDQNGANLAISTGRADVGMADSPVAAYIVKKSSGQFKIVGTPYGLAPYGIAMAKGSPLAKPVLAGLKSLIADGTYKRILDKWGVSTGALTSPTINGATS